jgi:hypothetical protein
VKREADVKRALEEWRGAGATLWKYTVSHGQLEIRLHRSGERGNVHVVCGGCERIEGPTVWPSCALEIKPSAGGGLILCDDVAGFSVQCEFVGILRDVEPVY